VFGIAFASLALLTGALWQFYAVLFLIGLIGNGTTQLAWARAVTACFDAQRGVALSLTMAGGGLGSILVPWFTAFMVTAAGWRWAYALSGCLVLLAGPALALGVLPSERKAIREQRQRAKGAGSGLRNPVFQLLLAGFFLVSLGANGCVAHLVALLTDRGLSAGTAAGVMSVLGVASVSGRLLTGFLIDRLFAPRVGFCFVAASAAGILMLVFTGSVASASLAAALIGLAMGAEADVFPYLISRYMGLHSFAEMYGYAFSAYAVGGALGPLLMGFAHDQTHSYAVPLIAGTLATAVAATLLLLLPPYGRSDSSA
jgi:MFS family permease